jgi:hypothetical protein
MSTPHPFGPTIAALAAAAALALAGCGGGGDSASTTATTRAATVDTAAVEKAIDEQLSTTDTAVTSVTCPEGVQVEVGSTFDCSVGWSNGATGTAEVTQESLKQLTYQAVPGSVKVPGATVEQSIERELDKQGAPDGQADCPQSITVKLDTPITCDLKTSGGKTAGKVTFMFSEDSGTVDEASVETT